jgi:hypothetical protein
MNVRDMLTMYRGAASGATETVVEEFSALSPSEQREFLFRAFLDIATHPTRIEHVTNAATKPS